MHNDAKQEDDYEQRYEGVLDENEESDTDIDVHIQWSVRETNNHEATEGADDTKRERRYRHSVRRAQSDCVYLGAIVSRWVKIMLIKSVVHSVLISSMSSRPKHEHSHSKLSLIHI